jgi:hypothetical protein
VTLALGLNQCTVSTPEGDVTLNGTASLVGDGFCPDVVLPPIDVLIDVTGAAQDATGAASFNTSADLSGTVRPLLGGRCVIAGADFTFSGMVETEVLSVGTFTLGLQESLVAYRLIEEDPLCFPVDYTLTFDGPGTLADSLSGSVLDVQFNRFALKQTTTESQVSATLSGGMESACLGGSTELVTPAVLQLRASEPCPSSGTIEVTEPGQGEIGYSVSGVDIQDGTGMRAFPSCVDSQLLACAPQ